MENETDTKPPTQEDAREQARKLREEAAALTKHADALEAWKREHGE